MSPQEDTLERIRIGISSCLLGAEVRFDGGHKRDAYLTETLARYFEFVPVCPEMAIGLGVPREPIRLVRGPQGIRAVGARDSSRDFTDRLETYGRRMAAELKGLCGYVFKRASPSCGMERVRVYSPFGTPAGQSAGVYARAFMAANPLLPCEEEGRLADAALRENFIERVYVYRRWQDLLRGGLTPARLVAFHTEHKFQVLAHSQAAYRRLGRLVAEAGRRPMEALAREYAAELMGALKRRATRRAHANVLQHLLGYVSERLDAQDRQELVGLIERYRQGIVPLVAPLTLLEHHLRRHRVPYLERQHYLNPYPEALGLRNVL